VAYDFYYDGLNHRKTIKMVPEEAKAKEISKSKK
jgi:hypothetical protein